MMFLFHAIHQREWLVVPLTILAVLVLGVTPAHADTIHIVQAGENLRRIAERYDTTVPAILQANDVSDPDFVYVGQRLHIPTSSVAPAAPGTYVVQPGDTVFSIARRLGVSQRALARANGIVDPSFVWTDQRLQLPVGDASPQAGYRRHVVEAGETLFSIAMRYGVTANSLAQANELRSADLITTGQQLIIPGGASRPATESPTEGKWIDIDVRLQRLIAYESEQPVFRTTVSTGTASTPTVLGRFAIRSKLPSQHMFGPGYNFPDVPWVMYFHGAYAIHGAYWHSDFGVPRSHGCVNVRPADAQWLYNWAPAGTPVVVHQ
ncbi:MAG: putative peptidoglycan endopeptidase LytE [Anaerolineales bacterium]|nr:putative peptidoglycan endopeptidase LytE [Anaerolineales bacterium]